MRNDGEYLEDEITKQFKTITRSTHYWRRLHDTKAARNVLPAQPADFFCSDLMGIGSYHFEAKSQGGKTPRLKKFTQLSTMKRWALAGVSGYVLIHFHQLDRFFLVNVMCLQEGKPSWVLTEANSTEVGSVEEAIKELLG